ncbi:MAG: hypothetical protein ED557_15075 [Balneola sp.]|nr:MAG: hypothetical protein ED557_15075 [Balneola sp.]
MNNHISPFEFQKRRNLSELFSDSLAYFRLHSKSFLLGFSVFILPIILIDSTITAVYEINNPNAEVTFLDIIRPSTPLGFISNILGLISSVFSIIIVTGQVKQIRDGADSVPLSYYFDVIHEYFWRIIGISILVNIATTVSVIAFVVGALFVGVKLSLSSISGILEDNRSTQALEWSWNITKDQWWNTCAVLIIFGTVMFLSSFLILVPLYIVLEIGSALGIITGFAYVVVETIILQFPFLMISFLQMFYMLGLTFYYFNLKELKEGTGMISKIDELSARDE